MSTPLTNFRLTERDLLNLEEITNSLRKKYSNPKLNRTDAVRISVEFYRAELKKKGILEEIRK